MSFILYLDIKFLNFFLTICYLTTNFFISCRYWLFGEKEQKEGENAKSKRIRGWLPRPCTVEVIEKSIWLK